MRIIFVSSLLRSYFSNYSYHRFGIQLLELQNRYVDGSVHSSMRLPSVKETLQQFAIKNNQKIYFTHTKNSPLSKKLTYNFTTNNKSPNSQKTTNKHEIPPKVQSQGEKEKTNKINIEHQRKIREIEQEEIKQMNKKINLTRQNFNPFIAYLKLNRLTVLFVALLATTASIGIYLSTIIGFYPVQELVNRDDKQKDKQKALQNAEIISKKKLTLISKKFQSQKVSERIFRLFTNYYQVVTSNSISASSVKKIQHLTNKLQTIFSGPYSISVISSEQLIILCLPKNKILISNSLLRSPIFQQQQLSYLVLLSQQLFNQGYHIRTLSLNQIKTFMDLNSGSSQIKLRQIYSRNYKRNEILTNIDILNMKLKKYDLHEKVFQKLKQLNSDIQKGITKSITQNVYQRLYKYYIFVKIQ